MGMLESRNTTILEGDIPMLIRPCDPKIQGLTANWCPFRGSALHP